MNKLQSYGPLAIRIGVGILFLAAGLNKLSNPAGTAGFLNSLGFGAPVFWAWLLILSETIFGLLILIGYAVKVAAWPLIIIMITATLKVVLPAFQSAASAPPTNILLHLLVILSLLSLVFTGAGKLSLEKSKIE